MVDPAYFVNNVEALQVDLAIESEKAIVPFAGMADEVEESEEEQYELKTKLGMLVSLRSFEILTSFVRCDE